MGASGSAWIKPTKRKGLRADALERVPHPRFVRAGQRYFPLDSRLRHRVTVRIVRVKDGTCEARRESAEPDTVRVREQRLLAVDESGAGRYYRFVGYASRSAYSTNACVVETGPTWARVICPEWHPGLPIVVAAAELPPTARAVGAWLACRADLGADAPARVRPHRFTPAGADFEPARYPPVEGTWELPPAVEPRRPSVGPNCGDVVLFVAAERLHEARTGAGVYLTGHPPPVDPGGRAYLHAHGRVLGWRAVQQAAPRPSGTYVLLDGPWHPVRIAAPSPTVPASGVRDGTYGRMPWTWRSWHLDHETSQGET